MSLKKCIESRGLKSSNLQPGLQALGKHAVCVRTQKRKAAVSIDLDTVLQKSAPNAARWDYGIEMVEGDWTSCVWVEVHPAMSSEVKVVIQKLRWLRDWLSQSAECRSVPHEFYWIATKAGTHIDSTRQRQLNSVGLRMPIQRIEL